MSKGSKRPHVATFRPSTASRQKQSTRDSIHRVWDTLEKLQCSDHTGTGDEPESELAVNARVFVIVDDKTQGNSGKKVIVFKGDGWTDMPRCSLPISSVPGGEESMRLIRRSLGSILRTQFSSLRFIERYEGRWAFRDLYVAVLDALPDIEDKDSFDDDGDRNIAISVHSFLEAADMISPSFLYGFRGGLNAVRREEWRVTSSRFHEVLRVVNDRINAAKAAYEI